jgi:CheY-like chemotaxis protein/HPt (histidine-containing phosphotransfer) domain-containing protein
MQFYFQGSPYQVAIVTDGEQAVAAFRAGRFDIVLIDLQMPGMDGFTATRMIRAWESAHQHSPTPILALTANALRDAEEQSLAAGCTGILTTPITKAQLLAALDQYGAPAQATPAAPDETGTSGDIAVRIDEEIQRRRPGFLENRRKDLGMMQQAAARQDYEALRTMGHRIKGLAGSYGFHDIGAVGQRLEQAAQARDLAAIRKEIEQLATILSQVDEAA